MAKLYCAICTNERSMNMFVACPKCNYRACRPCIKRYLLTVPEVIPKCMGCNKGWTLEFVSECMDKQFHNKEYRDYRAKLLLERERSLLPETQSYVVTKEKLANMRSKLGAYRDRERELRYELYTLHTTMRDLRHLIDRQLPEPVQENGHSRRFVGHCPSNECKGFLGENYVCGLCNKKACKRCRQNIEEKHECNEEDIATAKLLLSDTKACPKCYIPIFKIAGCDQMFCTNCHTAFSWETGQVETGRIHNPHYYEWQRLNLGHIPREEGDIRCGGIPLLRNILEHLSQLGFHMYHDNTVICTNVHRLSSHIRHVELPRYREQAYTERVNRDLRILYLSGEITEKQWQDNLKKREKKREKNRSVYMILVMLVDTVDTLLSNVINMVSREEVEQLVNVQFENLYNYTVEQLEKIRKTFDNKVPRISVTWQYL